MLRLFAIVAATKLGPLRDAADKAIQPEMPVAAGMFPDKRTHMQGLCRV